MSLPRTIIFLLAIFLFIDEFVHSMPIAKSKAKAEAKAKVGVRIRSKRQIHIGIPAPPPIPRIPGKRQIFIGVPTPPPVPRVPVPYPYRAKSAEPLPSPNHRRQTRSLWSSDYMPAAGIGFPEFSGNREMTRNNNKFAYIIHTGKEALL